MFVKFRRPQTSKLEMGITISHTVKHSLCKRLWSCCKVDTEWMNHERNQQFVSCLQVMEPTYAGISYLEIPSCGIDLKETAMSLLWSSANVLSHSKVVKAKQPYAIQVLKLSAPSCRILCKLREQHRTLLKNIQIDYNFHDNKRSEDNKCKPSNLRLLVRQEAAKVTGELYTCVQRH